jgi:hypothetical protein
VSLGLLLLFAIAGGGVFYWQVEDLPPLDAVYLSVITAPRATAAPSA